MAKESDPVMWEYPAHTRAKHQILDKYLGGWFAKLASYPRILFFDAFAGRGRYNDGSHGSPLIALRKLLGHSSLGSPRMSACEFVFMFVERDKENAAALEVEIEQLKAEITFPKNVLARVVPGEFREVAKTISSELEAQNKRQAPTFAFIDPFGYSGLPLDTIAAFTKHRGSEVFVNFMVNHLGRFVERAGQESAVKDLFGMTPAEVMANFGSDENRAEYLRTLYEERLRSVAQFPYVNSFAMRNSTGNVIYYLIHGTRHPEGVKLMKQAMWSVDPEKGSTFSDRTAGREVLFTPDPDLSPLKIGLLEHFGGLSDVPMNLVEAYTYLELPYRETHVRPALKELEAEGKISVLRHGRSGTFANEKTWISFPE